ncbi:peptide-methionine (S)-S-oxide reductase [Patescibacteria group bacterium]|nr:MAG: peptide-methionine (S)-S-oxide reductase [Patescibacteria group bacterium]
MTSSSQSIVLAGGCFWCIDAAFRMINGITSVTSGYTGGQTLNPTYYQVVSGETGHAEAVRVEFNPSIISLEDVLDIFWALHNPTTLNRQGADIGPQYRSAIFYLDQAQKKIAEASIKKVAKLWSDPVVTKLEPLEQFYPAEPEHQNYFARNPQAAYCQVIINPKLEKLRQKFSERLLP